MKDTLVICPVYNEEKTVGPFYRWLRIYYHGDILFIDDGSQDASREILLYNKDQRTFMICHHNRYGYGAALLSGFRFAKDKGYGRLVTIDVDLQHNPEHIFRFFITVILQNTSATTAARTTNRIIHRSLLIGSPSLLFIVTIHKNIH